jgi:hypothetical protein
MQSGPGLGKFVLALAGRPILLWEALRAGFAMRRQGGMAPSADYLAWRFQTAYGDQAEAATPGDLASYLSWRRRMRSSI